ncbi:MAG: acyl-CoA dehydrogenase [Dehalococcoidia bacterium]|nr:acyl-CoA dehydrogenase [Dehalococcoidia bacterium]
MDLSLNETQELLQRSARDFLKDECPLSLVREMDGGEGGFPVALWQRMAGLGWTGLLIPESFGGFGGSVLDLAVLSQELGRVLAPVPFLSTAVLGALLVQRAGSEVQQRDLLPGIARGQRVLALAVTEPEYSWEAEGVQMTAVQSGGTWRLNGTKLFVHDAQSADTLVVAARTSGIGATGVTLFLVPAKAAGVVVRRVSGWAGEPQQEVVFTEVAVAADAVLGGVGEGWAALRQVYPHAGVALAAYQVGAIQQVYEFTAEYARTRRQFGVAIGTFQRVQDHLIDIVNHLDGARWTTYEAAWKLDEGKRDATEAASIAQAVASEGFYRSVFHAHEVHAGIGASLEYPLWWYTRRARTYYDYLGSPAHHRKVLARMLQL